MRKALLGLALLGAVAIGTSARAAGLPTGHTTAGQATVQPVYWNGDYCGPRCREHQWRRHERWEARRHWNHRRWEERRYGYYAYPRY